MALSSELLEADAAGDVRLAATRGGVSRGSGGTAGAARLHWTPEEDARFMASVLGGRAFEDIAAEHRRTPGAINSRAVLNAAMSVRDGRAVDAAQAASEMRVNVADVLRRCAALSDAHSHT